MQMDGRAVWLSSIVAGEESFDEPMCGWHTIDVLEGELVEIDGSGYYEIVDNNDHFGFKAYLRPQCKCVNGGADNGKAD